jgi:nicotinate-nucleotide adenylyltransferase
MTRIALFGGSFNPPHLGHVLCALWARSVAGVDALWVLPVFEHPYGKDLRPFADRVALCRLAFGDLPFVEVREDERENAGGRTITLLEKLQTTHPQTRFCLVGGTDTEQDLPNWYRGGELRERVDVIAIPRRGYDDNNPAALPAISSSLVRERLKNGEDTRDVLPKSVSETIAHSGWYR